MHTKRERRKIGLCEGEEEIDMGEKVFFDFVFDQTRLFFIYLILFPRQFRG